MIPPGYLGPSFNNAIPDGAAATPALFFSSDPDTGLYLVSDGILGLAVAGVERARLSATALQVAQPVYLPNGTNAAPSLAFTNDPDLGAYRRAVNDLAFVFGGAVSLEVGATRTWVFDNGGGLLQAADGSWDIGQLPAARIRHLIIRGQIRNAVQALVLANGSNDNVVLSTPPGMIQRITGPTAAFTLTGIDGGVDGTFLILLNTVAFAMTIANESTSAPENRIITPTGADLVSTTQCTAFLVYDGTSTRWRVVAFEA